MKVEVRVKDTRAAFVKHCAGKTWRFPGAHFPLTDEERANAAARTSSWVGGDGDEEDGSPDAGGTGDTAGNDLDAPPGDEGEQQPYPAAAE
jgi:hypothetical protein